MITSGVQNAHIASIRPGKLIKILLLQQFCELRKEVLKLENIYRGKAI